MIPTQEADGGVNEFECDTSTGSKGGEGREGVGVLYIQAGVQTVAVKLTCVCRT